MGMKPRKKPEALPAFDVVGFGPYRVKVELSRVDGAPVSPMRIARGTFKVMRNGKRLDLQVEFKDGTPGLT